MHEESYYVSKLKEILSSKQRENPLYSMRAFARDLDVHGATMSQILNGKRHLPIKKASDVAKKLSLAPKEKTLFMESFFRAKTSIDAIEITPLDKRFMLDESYYKVISEWEHYAVLELFNLNNFRLSSKSIAEKLNISTLRVDCVLKNLLEANLIENAQEKQWSRKHSDVRTTEDISSSALRESHKETLKMGIKKIDEIEVELRDFSSTTVAVDLDKLPEAKTIIREFRQKMTALLRDGEKTDVYQLAIQFYPLTQPNQQENNV